MYRDPAPPQNWVALDTQFGDVRSPNDFGAEFRASEFIQSAVMNTDVRVLVFPEMVVTRWTEATEAFWEPTLRKLAEQRRTLIVGAGLPIENSRDYRNALVVAGAEKQHFFQRIPLPWVMWNPIAAKDRVPLRLRGPAILTVAGERAAPLICYEQLIPWPILSAAMDHPSAILAVSNATWTHDTPIPSVQKSSIAAWSRLFRIPVLSATNGSIPLPAD
jgi:apolipoprotein N-acyltransferase